MPDGENLRAQMAVCFRIEPTVDNVVGAFAMNDVMLKAVAWREGLGDESPRAMGTGDDYYTAPFGYIPQEMRKSKDHPDGLTYHWLIFTSHKVRQAHEDAVSLLHTSRGAVRLVGSLIEIENGALGAKVGRDKWTPFRECAWAGGDDVCTKLEDHAFKTTCEALGLAADADWRARRTVKIGQLCATMSVAATAQGVAATPLAILPEWGKLPYAVKGSAERAQAEAEAAKIRAEAEANEKKRTREATERANDERAKRYAPAIAKYKNAEVPDTNVCVFVFDTAPDGAPGPFPCPYDHKEGSPFCSMCKIMVEKLA